MDDKSPAPRAEVMVPPAGEYSTVLAVGILALRTQKKGRPTAALEIGGSGANAQFDTSCVVLVSRIGW
jgi:hypothetical protein